MRMMEVQREIWYDSISAKVFFVEEVAASVSVFSTEICRGSDDAIKWTPNLLFVPSSRPLMRLKMSLSAKIKEN